MRKMLAGLLAGVLLLSGCTAQAVAKSDDTAAAAQQPAENAAVQGGFTENQTLDGADGIIHFSYYLPDGYDSAKTYPLIVAMPGYGEMWFGEDSAGSNLRWNGVQANELAEYMIDHFSVDTSRVYAAGYSAGGETMSQAVALRPDLYAAYIHGGSQWDGTYDPVAENRVAVYIFMAENDEYYGSQKARDAYANLHAAYEKAGLTDSEIDQLLQLNIPDNAYFNAKGIYNYHGGGSVVFDDENVLNWVLSQRKSTGKDDNNEKDEATSDGGHGGSAGDRSDSDGPGGRGYL